MKNLTVTSSLNPSYVEEDDIPPTTIHIVNKNSMLTCLIFMFILGRRNFQNCMRWGAITSFTLWEASVRDDWVWRVL